GVVVFSMREREGFAAHDAYYEGFASVARELNGKKKLGEVFLFGEKRTDLRLTAREGPDTVTLPDTFGANLGKPISYPSITHLDVAYRKARYLFAVNSASQPVKVRVEGLPEGSITMRDLFGGRTTELSQGEFETSFEPLEVKGWEIKLPKHRR
ncbi:MAG: hypothetical protein HY318_03605, partial [Armatimonadetes bacterium]|nr:hypothetical protein [Armatimonadota bacterium]